jgi:hypothetical protein
LVGQHGSAGSSLGHSIVGSLDVVRDQSGGDGDTSADHNKTCCADGDDASATPAVLGPVEWWWAAHDGVSSLT